MSIPDLDLDNRSFQDLVDEARTRIRANCPEWTEHNVSDPGITLVESFAWMTDQLIYRLNQVPDKLHVALLNLLGIRREPASAARTGVRFRLIDGAELPVLIPAESTEVATTDGTVVFRVEDDFVVPPVRLASVVTAGAAPSAQPHTIPVSDGAARPAGDDDAVIFSSPRPVAGDAIHLGFASALSRLVIRVDVAASSAHGSGVVADDPPLVWEVSGRDGGWVPVEVITDTTGGFNRPTGHVELQMPPETAPRMVGTRSLHWLRCVVSDTTRSGRAADLYETSPRLSHITARVVGALVVAVNATREHEELLGPSDDTPGQTFGVRHDSALKLERKHDGLSVRIPPATTWEPWHLVESFDDSERDDPHFRFDAAAGEVQLGPAVAEPDGSGWRQKGKRPPVGAELRFSYWYGGGERGHVAAGALKVLRTGVPGVESVLNPLEATGGADPESLDRTRARAPMELQARDRAVTRRDFEFLAEEIGDVARAHCGEAEAGHEVPVYVLARVPGAHRRPSVAEFTPSDALLKAVTQHLDARRLIGTRISVRPARLVGVTVVADVRPTMYADRAHVKEDVIEALERFIHPLTGGSLLGPSRDGWDFGRPVAEMDVVSVIERLPGVAEVRSARLFKTELHEGRPDKPAQMHAESRLELLPYELPASSRHRVRVDERAAG